MKFSWKEPRTNKDILSMVQEERSMVSTIRIRQKSCIGHTHTHAYIYIYIYMRKLTYENCIER